MTKLSNVSWTLLSKLLLVWNCCKKRSSLTEPSKIIFLLHLVQMLYYFKRNLYLIFIAASSTSAFRLEAPRIGSAVPTCSECLDCVWPLTNTCTHRRSSIHFHVTFKLTNFVNLFKSYRKATVVFCSALVCGVFLGRVIIISGIIRSPWLLQWVYRLLQARFRLSPPTPYDRGIFVEQLLKIFLMISEFRCVIIVSRYVNF